MADYGWLFARNSKQIAIVLLIHLQCYEWKIYVGRYLNYTDVRLADLHNYHKDYERQNIDMSQHVRNGWIKNHTTHMAKFDRHAITTSSDYCLHHKTDTKTDTKTVYTIKLTIKLTYQRWCLASLDIKQNNRNKNVKW